MATETVDKEKTPPNINDETYRCNKIRNTTIYVDRTDPNHSIIVSGSKEEIEAFASQVHSATPPGRLAFDIRTDDTDYLFTPELSRDLGGELFILPEIDSVPGDKIISVVTLERDEDGTYVCTYVNTQGPYMEDDFYNKEDNFDLTVFKIKEKSKIAASRSLSVLFNATGVHTINAVLSEYSTDADIHTEIAPVKVDPSSFFADAGIDPYTRKSSKQIFELFEKIGGNPFEKPDSVRLYMDWVYGVEDGEVLEVDVDTP